MPGSLEWLIPGLGLKRWLVLASVGGVLLLAAVLVGIGALWAPLLLRGLGMGGLEGRHGVALLLAVDGFVAGLALLLYGGRRLWLFQRTAFGTPSEEFADDPHITDVQPLEWLAWAPFLAAIVVFGFFPGLMFDVTEKALVALQLGS